MAIFSMQNLGVLKVNIITGSYVWITQGPHAQEYGVVMSFAGIFAEIQLPNRDMVIIPIAWLRLAAP